MEDPGDFLPIHTAIFDGKIQQLEQIVANDPKSILSTTSKGLSPFHLCFSRQEREEGGVSPLALLSVLFSSPAKEEVGKVLEKADPWQGNTPLHSLIIWYNNHQKTSFRVFGFVLCSMFEEMVKVSLDFLTQQNRDGDTPLALLSNSPFPITLFPILARLIPSQQALKTLSSSTPLSLFSSYPTADLSDEIGEKEGDYVFPRREGEGRGKVVRRCRESFLGRGGGEVSVEEGDVVEVLFVVCEWAYVESWGEVGGEKGFVPRRCVTLEGGEGGKVRRFCLEESEDGISEMIEGKVPTKSLSLDCTLDVFCHPKLETFRGAFLLAHKSYLSSSDFMEALILRFCFLTYNGSYLRSIVAQAVKDWRAEYPDDWVGDTILDKQFVILQKLEKILCTKLLFTPDRSLGKNEEGVVGEKLFKINISLPKKSVSVIVSEKTTADSLLTKIGNQLQLRNLSLLEEDPSFSPPPSATLPPSPPSFSPPNALSPSLAVLSSPKTKESVEADAFFATESTQLLKSMKNDLAYSIQKTKEAEEEEEGMYIIGVGSSFTIPEEKSDDETEMYIMGVQNDDDEMYIMGVEQNEPPNRKSSRRPPVKVKKAGPNTKNSPSEGCFSDGVRRKSQRGALTNSTNAKRRSGIFQASDIQQQLQLVGAVEKEGEKEKKEEVKTNPPSKERGRKRKIGGGKVGMEERAIELQAGVLVGGENRQRDSLVVRDIEIMAGFWDGLGGGKEESGGSGGGVGWGGAGMRKIPKEKGKKKGKGAEGGGGLLRAFSPGRKRAGEEEREREKEEEWTGGVLGDEKKKGRRRKDCTSPISPSSPLLSPSPFSSRSNSSITPRGVRERDREREKGLSPLPPPSKPSPPLRSPPRLDSSPKKEQKKGGKREGGEGAGNEIDSGAKVFSLLQAGKQIYLSHNDEYYHCFHGPLNVLPLPSLSPLSPPPPSSFSSSLPLFPSPPSLSNPFSLFLFLSPLEIAQRVTLHHHSLLSSLSPRGEWEEGNGGVGLVKEGEGMKEVVLEILLSLVDFEQRCAFLKKMIQPAVNFFNLNNYLATWAISSALSHPSVTRMEKTMKSLDEETSESLQAVSYLVSEEEDYLVYRKAIKRARPPLVPLTSPILEGKGAQKNNLEKTVDLPNLVKTADWLFDLRRGKEMVYQFSSDESRFFQFDKIKKKDEQELMWMSDVVEPKDPSKIIQDLLIQKRELEQEIERMKKETGRV